MLYARVVLGLPVEGPFDYIVTAPLEKKIKAGTRVKVSFGPKKAVGYVVGLSKKTKIKKLKSLLDLIDEEPILDKNMLQLTKKLSEYYCCSWGEAIETALPEGLRRGRVPLKAERTVPLQSPGKGLTGTVPAATCVLIHDLDGRARWEVYLSQIKNTLDNNKRALVLLPDIESAQRAKEIISVGLGRNPALLYRKQPKETEVWQSIKEGEADIVVGTRSAIFAPLKDLGLMIIDEEHNSVYKQDQVPHYHAREVALIRSKLEKAKLILGSSAPSLESFYLSRRHILKYISIPRKTSFPETQIIDLKQIPFRERKRNQVFTKPLEAEIFSVLSQKGKILLFLNRKGFATVASCHNCGGALKCERCNINLVYHFKEDKLICHYCNFRMELPKICPKCNSGYIKFSGSGTEKIESELHRLFPQAKIARFDESPMAEDTDIFVATSAIIKEPGLHFDLIGVLSIDNSLNRVDFRSSEKAFALLAGLSGLTDKKIIIQTHYPEHHIFQALAKRDPNMFYENELRQRRQLAFPPYKHLALVKLRSKRQERAEAGALALFERLKERNKNKQIKILSVNPGQPSKLRGNFYWQILISGASAQNISKFLKNNLKDFSHSGIIVTVDIDPV